MVSIRTSMKELPKQVSTGSKLGIESLDYKISWHIEMLEKLRTKHEIISPTPETEKYDSDQVT